jgi:hypothetical protein
MDSGEQTAAKTADEAIALVTGNRGGGGARATAAANESGDRDGGTA